jgi:hypothetical protein
MVRLEPVARQWTTATLNGTFWDRRELLEVLYLQNGDNPSALTDYRKSAPKEVFTTHERLPNVS